MVWDCTRVQVVLCEREHGWGGGQEHLQASGAGRGLVAHLIPPSFVLYNLIVQEHHTNTNSGYDNNESFFYCLKGLSHEMDFAFDDMNG